MARKPRFGIPGIPQHVIQRGNNRDPCFFSDQNRRYYLESLQAACARFDCTVHAYVLMTNHVHLLVTPASANGISWMMQSLGRRYVRYINDSYQRTGTLWEGRYRAGLVETGQYLLTCYRYIELNPVRAGMVPAPGDYAWSSYHYNALGVPDALVTAHADYRELGSNQAERRCAYRELFRQHLAAEEVYAIRQSVNDERVLGSDRFRDWIEQMCQRCVRPGKAGRPRGEAG